jgi:uncharacterized membrane protein
MRRLPLVVLLSLILAAGLFVLITVDGLPARVATHFGVGGMPNGWMSRSGYMLFMLCFTVAFPLLVSAMAGGLPRLLPNLTNVPHRRYWMAPERREATLDFLAGHACWLGCMIALLAGAVHWMIVQAHGYSPVRLPTASFVTTVGVFLLGLGIWIARALLRFRPPR